MRVLVDTSVWSLALRQKKPDEIAQKLAGLIIDSMVVLIGPVRQELLSGISSGEVFEKLKMRLQAFEDLPLTTKDHEKAAEFYNACRKSGIQGSHIDFLICAVAHNNELVIFTTDQDFQQYAKVLPIRLMKEGWPA